MYKSFSNKVLFIGNKNNYFKALIIFPLSLFITFLFTIVPILLQYILNSNIIGGNQNNPKAYIYIYFYITATLITTYISLVFYSSKTLGEIAYHLVISHNTKKNFKRLLFWLKPKFAFKAFMLCTSLIIIKSITTFVSVLPSLILILIILILAFTGGIEVYLFISLLVGVFILFLTGAIFAFIANQRYFLAKYLLAENPKLGVIQVLKQSKNLMDGQIFRVIKFKLSFMPAFILYLLVFPIIFIHPHYKQCCCIIAKELRL